MGHFAGNCAGLPGAVLTAGLRAATGVPVVHCAPSALRGFVFVLIGKRRQRMCFLSIGKRSTTTGWAKRRRPPSLRPSTPLPSSYSKGLTET